MDQDIPQSAIHSKRAPRRRARAALPTSLKRRFLKNSSFAAHSHYMLQCLGNTANFKTHVHARARTHTYTHTHTRSHTHSHTRTALLQGHRTPLPGQGEWVQAAFAAQCADLLQIQCKVSKLMETKSSFVYTPLPDAGSTLMNHRVHGNSLKPPVGGFLFPGLALSLQD